MENKLKIELVPSTSWCNNVRSAVSDDRWDKIRYISYRKANHKCEICGETGKDQGYDHNVECHEIWEYEEKTYTQTLVGFTSLCPKCHKAKHAGLAQVNDELEIVYERLMHVNGMTYGEAKDCVHVAFLIFNRRSIFTWDVDISYIDKYLVDNDPMTAFMLKY